MHAHALHCAAASLAASILRPFRCVLHKAASAVLHATFCCLFGECCSRHLATVLPLAPQAPFKRGLTLHVKHCSINPCSCG